MPNGHIRAWDMYSPLSEQVIASVPHRKCSAERSLNMGGYEESVSGPHTNISHREAMKRRRMLFCDGTTNSANATSLDGHPTLEQDFVLPQVNSMHQQLDNHQESGQAATSSSGTIFSPLYLGGPSHVCPHCGALFWNEERVRGRGRQDAPIYNKCCRGGSIVLPSYKPPPEPLLGLLTGQNRLSNHLFEGIRCYNSMLAMTSMGVNVIRSINDGRGPYVFKVSGQLCHRIGSLVPLDGRKPEYCQLYIFDTENEVKNRLAGQKQMTDLHGSILHRTGVIDDSRYFESRNEDIWAKISKTVFRLAVRCFTSTPI